MQTLQDQPVRVTPTIGQNLLVSSAVSFSVKTLFAPIERFKLLYQAQGELIRQQKLSTPWTSYPDQISRVVKNEGFLSLWKGNGTYLIRYTTSSGIGLMSKDQLFDWDPIGQYVTNTPHQNSLSKKIIYGGLGGLIGMTFAYPFEYGRTRYTNDLVNSSSSSKSSASKGHGQFTSPFDAVRQAYKIGGISGVYRGFSMTIPTIMLYRGLEYGFYDYFCQNQSKDSWTGTWYGKFITAYFISNSLAMLLYPFSTLRVRFVMSLDANESRRYKGFGTALYQIYANEGARVFFRGAGANLFKNIGTSLVLVGYDKASEGFRRNQLKSVRE